MNINVHIERLILDGLPVESHHKGLVKAAVEVELAGLIAAQGLAPSLLSRGVVPCLSGGLIRLTGESKPGALGTLIAQQVYARINL